MQMLPWAVHLKEKLCEGGTFSSTSWFNIYCGSFFFLKESRFKLVLNFTDTLEVLLNQNWVLEMSLSITLNQAHFFPPRIFLKLGFWVKCFVDVSTCQIAGRALARRLRDQQGCRACLHRKFMGFWVLGSRCTIPSAEPPAEPSAEGATFRVCAVCGGSLGLSLLQIPRNCSENPVEWWFVPQDWALCCYFGVWGTWGLCGYLVPAMGGFCISVPELGTPLFNHLLCSDLQSPKAQFLCQVGLKWARGLALATRDTDWQ